MKTSITPSKVREQYSDHRLALCKGVQDILDSGIHAMDFKFQVVDSGSVSRAHAGGAACEKAVIKRQANYQMLIYFVTRSFTLSELQDESSAN